MRKVAIRTGVLLLYLSYVDDAWMIRSDPVNPVHPV
jgi:hypothetical protein